MTGKVLQVDPALNLASSRAPGTANPKAQPTPQVPSRLWELSQCLSLQLQSLSQQLRKDN